MPRRVRRHLPVPRATGARALTLTLSLTLSLALSLTLTLSLTLCLEPQVLEVFGHPEAAAAAAAAAAGGVHDVAYINWLLMVRAG